MFVFNLFSIQERLAAQLVEKDSDLNKWREERDKLVEALEVQLKTLASKTIQKDKEIAELKQSVLKDSGKVSFFFLTMSLASNKFCKTLVLLTISAVFLFLNTVMLTFAASLKEGWLYVLLKLNLC